jgi:hypothetical protein
MMDTENVATSGFDAEKHLTRVGGAQYLEVKWRVYWLRTAHPDAIIATELISHQSNVAVFKAKVEIPGGGSATGWGSESYDDFRDYLEKAETKALGRALAVLGFGTQFAGDDLEDDRTARSSSGSSSSRPGALTEPQRKKIWASGTKDRHLDSGEIEDISIARYGGKVSDLTRQQASDFIWWLESGDLDTLAQKESEANLAEARPASTPADTSSLPPKAQEAIAHRDANWIAAIQGAASVGEVAKIGNQISEAREMSPAVRAAFDERLAKVRKN